MPKDCARPDDRNLDVHRTWGPFVGADGSATIKPGDVRERYTLLLGIPQRGTGLALGLPVQNPAPDRLPGQRVARPL